MLTYQDECWKDDIQVDVCADGEWELFETCEDSRRLTFTRQNFAFYAAIVVAVLEIVSLLLFWHKLRHLKDHASYTRISVQQMG
jgi:hypothetical protein